MTIPEIVNNILDKAMEGTSPSFSCFDLSSLYIPVFDKALGINIRGGVFYARIWSKWNDVYTFSIVMVEVSPLMEEIHNEKKRMPLILEGDKAEAWVLPDLTKPEMADLMKTYENDDKLITYRVLDGVTNSRIDTNVPEVIEPIKENLNLF